MLEELVKYRLETLKMAQEIIFKNYGALTKDKNQIHDDLQDTFSLSDVYLQYILRGTHPSYDEEENNI